MVMFGAGLDKNGELAAFDIDTKESSPTLLDACKLALEEKARVYANTFDSTMDNDPVVIALRAAIAKAEKES